MEVDVGGTECYTHPGFTFGKWIAMVQTRAVPLGESTVHQWPE
jgi:hypothetical protein